MGNSRVNFDTGTGVARLVQTDDYYPFGMDIATGTRVSPKNNYLYNKKELQENLGLYDYGARLYDPVIGRWTSVDPLAELDRRWSSYNYGNDNPIRNIDRDGMAVEDIAGGVRYTGADVIAAFNQLKSQFGEQQDKDKGKQKGKNPSSKKVPKLNINLPRLIGRMPMNGQFYNVFSNGQLRLWDAGRVEQDYTPELIASFFLGIGEVAEGAKGSEVVVAEAAPKLLGTARMNILNAVENQELKGLLSDLYRPGAAVGDGSTADMIKIVGDQGHIIKGQNYLKALQKIWVNNRGQLNEPEKKILSMVLNDLKNALKTVK